MLSVLLSSWYAITYNDSHLVVPMYFEDYVFDIKDFPMIVSVFRFCFLIEFVFKIGRAHV